MTQSLPGRPLVRRALALAAALLMLSGCGSDEPASLSGQGDSQGYVAGSGLITRVAPADRSPAPVLEGETLDGRQFRLADHRGKVVLVNVWGSWCAPCRKEAPALESAWQSLKGRDVQFVGLDERDRKAQARAFVDSFGVTYPNVFDADGLLLLGFRDVPPNAIPSTLVLDRQGRLAARVSGEVSEATVRGLVEEELNRTP